MHNYSIADDLKAVAAKLQLLFLRIKGKHPKPIEPSYYRYLKAAIKGYIKMAGLTTGETLIDAIESAQENLKDKAGYAEIFDTAIEIDGKSVNLLVLCDELRNAIAQTPE